MWKVFRNKDLAYQRALKMVLGQLRESSCFGGRASKLPQSEVYCYARWVVSQSVSETTNFVTDAIVVTDSRQRFLIRLEREQCLVWTFDLLFGLEEFFTPRFAGALGALVNRVPNRKTVIAGSLGAGAGELLASLAGLEELAFERSVLVPQFVFTDDAHALVILPTTQLLRLSFCLLGQF